MRFVVALAHALHGATVDMRWNLSGVFYRVEIWNKRDRYPVVPGDSLVAGNYRTHLARLAAAQFHWGLGADALKIDSGVPGRIHGAEEAVRLLHQ